MCRPWEKKTEKTKHYSSQIIKEIRKTYWQLKINYQYVYICIYASLYIKTHTQINHIAVYIYVIHRDISNTHNLYRLCTYVNSPCVSLCVWIYMHTYREREREKMGFCTQQAHTDLHNETKQDSQF